MIYAADSQRGIKGYFLIKNFMKKANIGIKPENIKKVAEILEKTLADDNVLYVKIKSFHWNVVDKNFRDYHKFFDDLAEDVSEKIDEIAERIRSLGEFVNSNMSTYLKNSQLKENMSVEKHVPEMLSELLEDYELQIRTLRTNIDEIDELGDTGTADFLTGIMEEKEKQAWMIRSSNV